MSQKIFAGILILFNLLFAYLLLGRLCEPPYDLAHVVIIGLLTAAGLLSLAPRTAARSVGALSQGAAAVALLALAGLDSVMAKGAVPFHGCGAERAMYETMLLEHAFGATMSFLLSLLFHESD